MVYIPVDTLKELFSSKAVTHDDPEHFKTVKLTHPSLTGFGGKP